MNKAEAKAHRLPFARKELISGAERRTGGRGEFLLKVTFKWRSLLSFIYEDAFPDLICVAADGDFGR